MLPDALTPNMSTSTEPVGDPEPVEDHWARLRRQRKRDFTPPARGDSPDPEKWNKAALRGQAPAFLSALEKDVVRTLILQNACAIVENTQDSLF